MAEKVKTKHFIFNVFVSLHKVECGSKGEIIPCWDHGKNPKNQFYMHTLEVNSIKKLQAKNDICLGNFYHNPNLGLATNAKGITRLWAERKPGSHITYSQECKKV